MKKPALGCTNVITPLRRSCTSSGAQTADLGSVCSSRSYCCSIQRSSWLVSGINAAWRLRTTQPASPFSSVACRLCVVCSWISPPVKMADLIGLPLSSMTIMLPLIAPVVCIERNTTRSNTVRKSGTVDQLAADMVEQFQRGLRGLVYLVVGSCLFRV